MYPERTGFEHGRLRGPVTILVRDNTLRRRVVAHLTTTVSHPLTRIGVRVGRTTPLLSDSPGPECSTVRESEGWDTP